MLLTDGHGTPLGVKLTPANEAEVTHIDSLLDEAVVLLPSRFRLMYDKAADSDGLRDTLAADGIELICAHRKNRKRPKRQDGRTLRRAKKRRWRVERSNAWLHNFRRFSNRYERRSDLYLGFVQLACLFTILKRF